MICTADCAFLNNNIRLYTIVCTENSCIWFITLMAQEMINTKRAEIQNIFCPCIYICTHIQQTKKCQFSLFSTYQNNNNNECGNKMPTRCNRGFYCRSYCLLNMFRAPLCPSSGAQEYYTAVAACGISCCGVQVAGLVWS